MIDQLRTLSARFITRWLRRPRALIVRAWFWLAAEAAHLEEQRRCLEAILELDPENEPAGVALQWVLECQRVTELHPANASDLANSAGVTVVGVLKAALCYPSESCGWPLGEADLLLEVQHETILRTEHGC